MKKTKKMWRLIAKALGEKSSDCNKEADTIAFIRLILILQAVITNMAIIAGIIHNW